MVLQRRIFQGAQGLHATLGVKTVSQAGVSAKLERMLRFSSAEAVPSLHDAPPVTPARAVALNGNSSKPGVPGASWEPMYPRENSGWLVYQRWEDFRTGASGSATPSVREPIFAPNDPLAKEGAPSRSEMKVTMEGAFSPDAIAEKVIVQIGQRIGRRQLNRFADLIYERLVHRMNIEKERTGGR
jgi:hypothetical protein